MSITDPRPWLGCVVLFALFAGACGPSEPLNVVGIQTGKSLNSDHSIGAHAASFHPNDTMYVSVLSNGRGKGTITVKWSLRALQHGSSLVRLEFHPNLEARLLMTLIRT